ncbi:MAG: hypothetical protein P0Y53_07195 [Candidatus Pseudobacter hemicellulosilyticus]|uniref:DUF1640 domain-containing protein n=1 Tax=Candidatus Pseudobacter hemicellulosilyticus TaxID=3121375 RepID=A0AAJ6BIH2_9BACT|nr:MAG: hypothetical protein P0Y53_07195 [Pseudobacter sp.]
MKHENHIDIRLYSMFRNLVGLPESHAAAAAMEMNTIVTERTAGTAHSLTESLRMEMREQTNMLRQEMREQTRELRAEMKEQFTELRTEIQEQSRELREHKLSTDHQFALMRTELREHKLSTDHQFAHANLEMQEFKKYAVDSFASKVALETSKTELEKAKVALHKWTIGLWITMIATGSGFVILIIEKLQ